MFNGYLSLGGTELINAARVEAYVANQMPRFNLRKTIASSEHLNLVLDEPDYESPALDNAPWFDESDPATERFYGFYPQSIAGIGDSTRTAPVTESILDGGFVGSTRHGTRQVRVRGMLIGLDEVAVESGRAWLARALEGSSCDSHGGSCSGGDLCWFVDMPPVYPGMIDYSTLRVTTVDIGSVSPGTSPVTVAIPESESAATCYWNIFTPGVHPYNSGTIAEWGAFALDDDTILQRSGEKVLARVNYIKNPSFTRTKTSWAITAGGQLAQVAAGGIDGLGFGRVTETTPVVTRTNWLPGTSFESNPTAAGWRTNGAGNAVLSTPAVGAPDGTSVGVATRAAGQTDLWIEVTALGPVQSLNGYLSFYVKERTEDVLLTVTDPLGVVVHEELYVNFNTPYKRVGSVIPFGANYVVRLTTPGEEALVVDAFLLEDGAVAPGTYFNGGFADSAGVDYSYLGAAVTSASRVVTGVQVEHTLSNPPILLMGNDDMYGRAITRVAMRSALNATVELRIVDPGNAVIASQTITLTPTWQTYTLNGYFTNGSHFEVRAKGSYDIDRVDLEPGTMVFTDYLDGDEFKGVDYKVTWTDWTGSTLPNRETSPSMMVLEYTLPTDYVIVDEPAPTMYDWVPRTSLPDSNWRPFLRIVQGGARAGKAVIAQFANADIEACVDPFSRRYHDVTCIEGPIIVSRPNFSFGAGMIVEFTLVAASPHALANTRDVDLSTQTTALWEDVDCTVSTANPLLDPDCPPVPAPPRPPVVPDACIESPTDWRRYWLDIPRAEVSTWSKTLPTLTLSTLDEDVRQVRVRFTPNPFSYPAEEVDPCDFCSEFILSYLPANTRLVVDATVRRAFAEVAGAPAVVASQLLYGTDGLPMSWPDLSCGTPYVMTVDIPPADADSIVVELALTRQE